MAWVVLAPVRATEADLGVDEARGATRMTTARARACRRGSSACEASVPHRTGPFQDRSELGLAKTGHRRRGLAGRGLVNVEFRGRMSRSGKRKRNEKGGEGERKRKKKKRKVGERKISLG